MKFLIALIFSGLFCGLSARLDTDWWKNTEIYDIVVSAYKDFDSDGFGDFGGIISKLDYIKSLGVHAIKLSPIFASSDEATTTYGIEDFKNVHLAYGTMEDFDTLVQLTNAKGIKVILDLLINHCSVEHEWFKKSQNRIEPYTDYFIWSDGNKNTTYFENSKYSAWEYNEQRKQYYYHTYETNTADLNLKNEAVKNEIKDILKLWLDKGVSGFNLLSANFYVKDDEIKKYEYPPSPMLDNKPESYEFVHELRELMDIYNHNEGGNERILIVEEKPVEKYPNLRGTEKYPIAHIVSKVLFGNKIDDSNVYYKASQIKETVTNIMQDLKNGPTMYILEDSSLMRSPNRFQDRQYLDVWLTTLFMLPGVLHIYYGQEIGISTWKFAELKTTVMHWDESINAGFTDNEISPYAPNVDYWKVNVKNLKKATYSTLKSIKDLLKVRKTKAVQLGDLKTYEISDFVFAFSRSTSNQEKLIAIINSSNGLQTVNLKKAIKEFIPGEMRVVSSSPNSIYHTGDLIETASELSMRPVSAIVISIKK